MMGVGYWLSEKLDYNSQTGELMTNRTWSYKVPGPLDIPIDFRVKFLENVNNEGIYGSKATGEPSLNLAIVVMFALRHAIDSIRADNGKTEKWFRLGTHTYNIHNLHSHFKFHDFGFLIPFHI